MYFSALLRIWLYQVHLLVVMQIFLWRLYSVPMINHFLLMTHGLLMETNLMLFTSPGNSRWHTFWSCLVIFLMCYDFVNEWNNYCQIFNFFFPIELQDCYGKNSIIYFFYWECLGAIYVCCLSESWYITQTGTHSQILKFILVYLNFLVHYMISVYVTKN